MTALKHRGLLERLYRYFWSFIVTALILAAVLFTVVRLALPYANAYRVEAEQALTKTLGQRVTVDSMTAELSGVRPSLVLNGVTVFGAAGKHHLFRFDSLSVGFSVTKSFTEKKAIPVSLNIKGTRLDISRDAAGKFSINGVPLRLQQNGNGAQMPQYQPVLQWLFHHGRLGLEGVALSYADEQTGQHLQFENVQLKLKSSGERHQVDGIVHLPQGWGQTAGFSIDMLAADMRDSKNWKISSFLIAQELNLPLVTKTFPINGSVIEKGTGNVQLWSDWQGLELASFQAELSVLNLAYRAAEKKSQSFSVDAVSAQLDARRLEGDVWSLEIPRLQMADQAITRDPIRMAMRVDRSSGNIDARVNLIYLQDVRRMLAASGQLKESWLEGLSGIAPNGEVRDLHLNYQPAKQGRPDYNLAFRLEDVSTLAWKKVPKFSGVSGTVWLGRDSGAALIDSRNMVADIQHVFRHPWGIKQFKGMLQWRKLGDTWHIQSDRLSIQGVDTDMDIRLHLMLPHERPGYLDLLARFDNGDLSQLYRYYPVNIMKPHLVEWLDKAIVSGRARSGGVVYHGSLKKHEFPYRQHQGKFEVAFEGEDVHLDYLKDWPALEHMHGDILFDGPGMRIDAKSGSINDMQVSDFSARIRNFRRPWLRLKGKVQGGTREAVGFIAHSPLRENFRGVIDRLQASGRSDLDLGMTIPLNKKLGHMSYKGLLTFSDSRFHSPLGKGRLEANAVNGLLTFTERGYRARNIKATMFQRPARIDVSTRHEGGERTVEMVIQGQAPSVVLNEELKVGLFHYLQGESDVTARLQMISGKRHETLLLVDSQMQGMAIDLPSPLGKPAEQTEAMHAKWDFNTEQLDLGIGEGFHAALWLADGGEGVGVRRGDLHFGEGDAKVPDQDVLRLTGRLTQLPLSRWLNTLSNDGHGQDISENVPLQVRLDYMQVMPEEKAAPKQAGKGKEDTESQLKSIDVDVGQLVYKDIDLGRFTMLANSFNNGYKIDVLAFDGPVLTFSGKGYWNKGRDELTALTIKLNARSTETLLSTFGFNTPIRGGRLSIDGNLQWPGSPDQFKIETFEGNASFRITDGRLDNIEPGAGRVLGLFSFQALPRRLALDFRDLFGKGYRFDSIHGDFQVKDGNAYTRNMVINSPSARINMSGRTGLVAHDYDQDVIIVPGDGTNLFVAGALAGGLQTGVVVWLVERMLNVEKYTRFIYKITGTWDKPIITNLSETAGAPSAQGE
jgi:uncharacterized protein (TIGR02099 family)